MIGSRRSDFLSQIVLCRRLSPERDFFVQNGQFGLGSFVEPVKRMASPLREETT